MLLRYAVRSIATLVLTASATSVAAGSIVVTDTGASGPATCTLAQAIYAANLANNPTDATPAGATTVAPLSGSATMGIGSCTAAASGGNTIDLPVGATISFSSDAPDNFWYGPNALPPIASTIAIDGHGATLAVTLGTAPRLRFFFVGADPVPSGPTSGYNTPGAGHLTLRNLTLTGGRQKGGDGAVGAGGGAGLGGAIFNQGMLALDRVTMLDNTATGGGDSLNASFGGGGLGADGSNSMSANSGGGGMGGSVPNGMSENGGGAASITEGGEGGGEDNGLGGNGGASNGPSRGCLGCYGFSGNGGGGGGGTGAGGGGGGAGFGGGTGGSDPTSSFAVGGSFGNGGASFLPNAAPASFAGGGGVGGGGGGASIDGGGGGFGGGGGAKLNGNSGGGGGGGFGGGSGGGPLATNGGGGFGGGGAQGVGGAGAGMGGAIFNHFGTLVLLNCTLAGNTASGGSVAHLGANGGSGYGGAIFNLNGSVAASFSTLAANTVVAGNGNHTTGADGNSDGGAIYSLAYNANASTGSIAADVTLANSILSNSTGGSDFVIAQPVSIGTPSNTITLPPGIYLTNAATATAAVAGHNLVMSAIVASDALTPPTLPSFETNADPMLAAPAANGAGGKPFTMLPLGASPAYDAATCSDAFGNPIAIDERSFSRPSTHCDLGAFNGDHIFINGFE